MNVVVWSARILVAVLVLFRAFTLPFAAATGLDRSWQLAIAEASTHGLVFGRDIVFTYGPLGYLGIGAGIAPTYHDMVAASSSKLR